MSGAKMTEVCKPTTPIIGAVIVSLAIVYGAQRIAHELSFEGQWDSCVRTFNNPETQVALGIKDRPANTVAGICFSKSGTARN
jgi:hypothetical protein